MRLALLLPVTAAALFAQCEPPIPVRELLEKIWTDGYDLPFSESRRTRHEAYRAALEKHPHDYFLLRMMLMTTADNEQAIAWARDLRDRRPDQPVYTLIYAQALEGRNSAETVRLLEMINANHPELSRSHLALADLSRFGKTKDDARAKRELASFLAACPAPLDAAPLRTVGALGTKEQAAAVAAAVRKRIVEVPPELMAGVYEALWPLEFKATPPTAHAALRQQVAADLAVLEKAPGRDTVRWLVLLSGGYGSAGDPEAAKRLLDEIVAKYPKSTEAKRAIQERWRNANPRPPLGDPQKAEQWARAAAAQLAEWHRAWPDDSLLYSDWFEMVVSFSDSSPDEVARMGGRLLELYRKNPNWHGSLPVEWMVADAFLKKNVNVDQVPRLIDEGAGRQAKRDRDNLADDRLPDEFMKSVRQGIEERRTERARLLLSYYAQTKTPEPARAIEAELAAMSPEEPRLKAKLLERQAQAAELFGRKLDALLIYRAALSVRPQAPVAGRPDPVKENIDRLWKELGGSPAAYALLLDKAKPAEAKDTRWEKPKKPIPPFSVSDLQGKTWTLAGLEGRTVLINLWATWCAPCRAEHPVFQKLYDELKSRSDVSVITFNVDHDVSKVAPYMAENKYTFPVLLASEVVDRVLDAVAIPQNWFLTKSGKLEVLQVGFNSEPDWRDKMVAKLEEVGKLP